MATTSSRSIAVRRTSPPSAVQRVQSKLVFVSSTSPIRTSLPAETTSTMGARVASSRAPCRGMDPLMTAVY
jgi:hypothetical protein